MISTSYDPDADALYVRFNDPDASISDTREIEPGVLLDVDDEGRLVGLEILGVRARSASTRRAA